MRPWQHEGEYVRIIPTRQRARVRGGAALLLLGALFAGIVGGLGWQWWSRPPAASGPSSAIEWNAVQAVPTRAPDAEDVAWEKRAQEPLAEPVIATATEVRAEASSGTMTGRLYVIDGDTFGIGRQHIRILGMDAPETHPSRCAQEAQLGNAATHKLRQLLGSGTVMMSGSGRDQYGRELRLVFVNGVDVAQTMIGAGLARSYDGGKRQGWC